MKKIVFCAMLIVMASALVHAAPKNKDNSAISPDWECYRVVAGYLRVSDQFSNLLADAVPTTQNLDVRCTMKEEAFRANLNGLEKGDRVSTGSLVADLSVFVSPLNGLGGTREKIHVEGTSGFRFKVGNSNFFEVRKLKYAKDFLRK